MKKLFTLLLVLVAFTSLKAQNIPLINGDCSTDATLSGSSPSWTLPGFTVTETLSHIDPAQCGIANGALRVVGTSNGKQGETVVSTEKVDISTYGTEKTYAFACTVKATNATPVGVINVSVTAYDALGTVILPANAFVGGTWTKISTALVPGTAVDYGSTFTLNPTAGVAQVTFNLQVGKYVTTDLYLDDFTLFYGDVPKFNLNPDNLSLSTEAGVASAESFFTVDGTALTSDVMVYGGGSLEYSLTPGEGFSQDTLKLTPAGDGSLAPTIVYTRIKANITSVSTTSITLPNGQVKATAFSKGAGSKFVQFAGTVKGFATTIPTVDTLSYVQSVDRAYFKNIKVTANSLTSDLVVTAGSNLEIFTDTLAAAQSSIIFPVTVGTNDTVNSVVYMRLKKDLPVGIVNDLASTKLTIASTGYTTKEIQMIGQTLAFPTAVANVNNSNIKCYAVDGQLYIQGVDAGKQIAVFNQLGQKVKSVIASGNTSVAIPAKGIYFVKSDAFVQKVLIK